LKVTFKQAAERYHAAHAASWSATYAHEFLASLERWAYRHVGSRDVAAMDKDLVLTVLEQPTRAGGTFWHDNPVTADRVRNRMERTLDFARVHGWRSGDNPARWRGYLAEALPAPRKVAPVKHLDAAPYAQVPGIMAALPADVNGNALRFVVLTAARLGEALGARWDEIDFAAAEWTIPRERMKGRREHRVPLSPQAVELLKGLYREENNPYLFVGRTPGTPTANNTVLQALRRAGCQATVHGFRSSFSTWASERTNFPGIIVELSLAHRVGSAVENAYRRGAVIVKRRRLMEQWGRFVTSPPVEKQKGDKVVPLRA
jgi:integrase